MQLVSIGVELRSGVIWSGLVLELRKKTNKKLYFSNQTFKLSKKCVWCVMKNAKKLSFSKTRPKRAFNQ